MNHLPHSIAPLVYAQLTGTLSDQGRQELERWLEADSANRDTLQQMQDPTFIRENLEAMAGFDAHRFEKRLVRAMPSLAPARSKQTVHRVHLLKTAWVKYAAAILLLISMATAGYLWLNEGAARDVVQQQKPVTSQPVATILPGTKKAILTLSDGRQITLDGATSGTITDQNLTINHQRGQLSYGSGDLVAYNTMTTPRGGQYQVVLPDGSKVWLNAASSITYPTAFTAENRTLTVEGEAYFEIEKDADKPFVVKTRQEEIVVLGTAFNVHAYVDETLKTSLLEGVVKIGSSVLKPGQAYSEGQVIATDIRQDVAWKNGVFDFHQMPLEKVLRQLARWYDLTIVSEGRQQDVIVGGKMGRDLDLSQVLTILSDMQVKYRLKGKKLIIL